MNEETVVAGRENGIGSVPLGGVFELGCEAARCDRTRMGADQAVAGLAERPSSDRTFGHPFDAALFEMVVRQRLGAVGAWIDIVRPWDPQVSLWEQSPEEIRASTERDLAGTSFGVPGKPFAACWTSVAGWCTICRAGEAIGGRA